MWRGSSPLWWFFSPGGDDVDVEQTGRFVLCPGVDHHPGRARRVAITFPAYISPI